MRAQRAGRHLLAVGARVGRVQQQRRAAPVRAPQRRSHLRCALCARRTLLCLGSWLGSSRLLGLPRFVKELPVLCCLKCLTAGFPRPACEPACRRYWHRPARGWMMRIRRAGVRQPVWPRRLLSSATHPHPMLKVTLAFRRPAYRHPGLGQISTRCCGTFAAAAQWLLRYSGPPVEASQPAPFTI